jgi:hypothetical protein
MRGPVRRPARAAILVVAVTASTALILNPEPRPATRPPAVARSANPAAACENLRAGPWWPPGTGTTRLRRGEPVPTSHPPGAGGPHSLDSTSPRLRGLAALEQATDSSTAGEPAALTCIGNGSSGNRIQTVYAHASGVADRYAILLPFLRQWAVEVDQAVWASAGQTGGGRRVRYVTDVVGGSCVLDVANVALSAQGDDSFDQMGAELQAQGFDRTDRKYLVGVDAADGICV